MARSKNTKRALILSAMSLLLCVSMLVGTTFAWFTDTDTATVTNIVSGTLDIKILDANGNEKKDALNFVNKNGSADILWEPGATFRTEGFKLKNNGSLYLKYKIQINNTEVSYNKLNEVIDFSLVKEDGTVIDLATMKDIELAPTTGMSDLMFIEGKMQTTAGNEYQGQTMTGVSITVLAAQATEEFDSTTDQYDKDATYDQLVSVTTQAELNTTITNANKPTTIVLSNETAPYDFTSMQMSDKNLTFQGSKSTVIDATNHQWNYQLTKDATLTFDGVTVNWSTNNEGYQGFTHANKVVYKNCTITGTQFMYCDADFINCTFETENGYAVYGRGAGTLNFTDCTFTTGGRAIMLYQDQTTEVDVVMTNCKFSDNGTYSSKDKAVVETGDGQYKTSKFNITINDCTVTQGFETNNSTSNLWGNKDSIPTDRLNVVIDGIDVY